MTIVSWAAAVRISRIDGTATTIVAAMMTKPSRTGFVLRVNMRQHTARTSGFFDMAVPRDSPTVPPVRPGPVR